MKVHQDQVRPARRIPEQGERFLPVGGHDGPDIDLLKERGGDQLIGFVVIRHQNGIPLMKRSRAALKMAGGLGSRYGLQLEQIEDPVE